MIPVTKNLYLYLGYENTFFEAGSVFFSFKDKTLCRITHPEYEKAVKLAIKQGWIERGNRYRLTELGKALMKLMQ